MQTPARLPLAGQRPAEEGGAEEMPPSLAPPGRGSSEPAAAHLLHTHTPVQRTPFKSTPGLGPPRRVVVPASTTAAQNAPGEPSTAQRHQAAASTSTALWPAADHGAGEQTTAARLDFDQPAARAAAPQARLQTPLRVRVSVSRTAAAPPPARLDLGCGAAEQQEQHSSEAAASEPAAAAGVLPCISPVGSISPPETAAAAAAGAAGAEDEDAADALGRQLSRQLDLGAADEPGMLAPSAAGNSLPAWMLSAPKSLGKPMRIATPCKSKAAAELKSLQQGAGAEAGAEAENAPLGTLQLLSPVRTHKRLESALGAASHQVLTPVRRSARVNKPERLGAPLDAMLESTRFCYAPNAALQEVDDVAEATGALPAPSAPKSKGR